MRKIAFMEFTNRISLCNVTGGRRMSERDMTRVGNEAKPSAPAGPQLLNSKSVPALHHIGELKLFF